LSRTISLIGTAQETGVSPEVVLHDLSEEPIFMHRYMIDALRIASELAYFVNEEAIMAGAHLQWRTLGIEERWIDWEFDGAITQERWVYTETSGWIEIGTDMHTELFILLQLDSSSHKYHYTHLEIPVNDTSNPQQIELMRISEANAIEQQLRDFRNAQENLNNIEGLQFYINSEVSIGTTHARGQNIGAFENHIDSLIDDDVEPQTFSQIISNVDESQQTEQFFRTQLAYFIMTPASSRPMQPAYMNPIHFTWFGPSSNAETATIYLSFTQEVVDAMAIMYANARTAYIADLTIIGISAVLTLASLVVLLVGAGREYKLVDGVKMRDEIRFSTIDRVYLDIGFALIIGWTMLVVHLTFMIASGVSNPFNAIAFHLLFTTMALLAVPPILLWMMNLTKRIKAGKFWKHTLAYAMLVNLIYRPIRYCIREIRSQWSGAKLTGKVVIISVISFFILLFTGILGAASFNSPLPLFFGIIIFTPIIAFFLLRYAKRIRTLEQGAQRVCDGDYETTIEVGGGELGNIANSINNMSAGIHTAVEERLKSERMKTELITNVSHDIRTPLTSIITYTDLLEHEGLDCEKAPEYLDVLKQKSLRLKTLIDELFEAAKASTGNIDVNLTTINISSLIKQVLGELESAVQSSGLDIRTNLPEDLYATADGRLMQRVMENLLSNVFKYSMPNSRVYLDLHPADNYYIRLEIKNVSATELNFDSSELTERFKRGDESRTDGGSGLGLSIVQSFVTAQGGRFDISIDGDLFKAIVTLPRAQPTPPHSSTDTDTSN